MLKTFFLITVLSVIGLLPISSSAQLNASLPDRIRTAVDEFNKTLAADEKWGKERDVYLYKENKDKFARWTVLNRTWLSRTGSVQVEIAAAESKQNAKASFTSLTGEIADRPREKTQKYGDGGIIVDGPAPGAMTRIIFTQSNYYVAVVASSRAAAEQLAKLVEASIKERQQTASKLIRDHPAASRFYDTLLAREPDWKLVDFEPPHPVDKHFKSVMFRLEKGAYIVIVYISEYPNVEDAMKLSPLGSATNSRVESYTIYGEQGQKHYYDGFGGLVYRAGNFVVSIYCRDEPAAERFAAYTFSAVRQ